MSHLNRLMGRGVLPPVVHGVLHGYANIIATHRPAVHRRLLSGHTTALVFYLAVGVGGLVATLATRFEPRRPIEQEMPLPMAA